MTQPHDSEPKPMIVDKKGRKWWGFLYEYNWEGATYGFDICARSKDEADARLKRLPLARYAGQRDGNPIPANPATSIYVRALVWFRNLFGKKPTP